MCKLTEPLKKGDPIICPHCDSFLYAVKKDLPAGEISPEDLHQAFPDNVNTIFTFCPYDGQPWFDLKKGVVIRRGK